MARAFKGPREELAAIGAELCSPPPRGPELNAIERMWHPAMYEVCPECVHTTAEAVGTAVGQALNRQRAHQRINSALHPSRSDVERADQHRGPPRPSRAERQLAPMTLSLSNIDLNLLIPLHALLMERSVTKAAERVAVGQPAMSASLARLRRWFDDPLLVRHGRQMELTPLAESLAPQVDELLAGMRAVLSAGARFDPSVDHRVFTMVASDYVATVLLHPLLRELSAVAPNVRINIVALPSRFADHLRRGQLDMLIWPPGLLGEELSVFPNTALFSDEFVAVMDEHHPDVGTTLSTAQLSTLPYVKIVGPTLSVAEARLDQCGVSRQVVATTGTFTNGILLVQGTRKVLIAPRRLFDRFGAALGLRSVTLDPSFPQLIEAMYWHPKNTIDPGHRWLRERLQHVAGNL
ncbi:LysR family transcriptional regulator [Streptomyces sp. NA02950]|uniref:LysR family transcriptional regulator n=1 Tax=Streptomyces sp. NA02950 TaxID=2742137 RepID=UPI0015903C90|nr:LysR family transcriptional regulator [Streptomyces sp. NA02950]QKV90694.1 LysR family transcriptional regulator [Streptomyces sp. NA02950]